MQRNKFLEDILHDRDSAKVALPDDDLGGSEPEYVSDDMETEDIDAVLETKFLKQCEKCATLLPANHWVRGSTPPATVRYNDAAGLLNVLILSLNSAAYYGKRWFDGFWISSQVY